MKVYAGLACLLSSVVSAVLLPHAPFFRVERHHAHVRLVAARPVRRVSAGSCAVFG